MVVVEGDEGMQRPRTLRTGDPRKVRCDISTKGVRGSTRAQVLKGEFCLLVPCRIWKCWNVITWTKRALAHST